MFVNYFIVLSIDLVSFTIVMSLIFFFTIQAKLSLFKRLAFSWLNVKSLIADFC